MSTLTPAQRAQFLEKVRARKALIEKGQVDDKVEVLSQLEIGEVEEKKKKRKGGEGRIIVAVKTYSPKIEGEVKSPAKKRSKTLSRKSKKDDSLAEEYKDLVETEDPPKEGIPATDETVAGASHTRGTSPWDPLFDPEAFLARSVDMAGSSARFDSTGSDELMRMALGYELKGLLLNYALTSRQRAELAGAKEKEALVEKNLATLEDDVRAAKLRCEGDVKALREKHEEEIARLTKEYEGKLVIAQRDREAALKTVTAKDERIKTLAKDNEAALAALASLREEKIKWESDKDTLEATIGEQFEEGFQLALDQVKILFPEIDRDQLGKADAMLVVEGDKLVSPADGQIVQDTPNAEVSPKALLDEESPAAE
ncbi:hypothetical protein QL285_088629 [Trifolium repens]|nr:hypothetical protein QL285_088629 [Trifolium repens]